MMATDRLLTGEIDNLIPVLCDRRSLELGRIAVEGAELAL